MTEQFPTNESNGPTSERLTLVTRISSDQGMETDDMRYVNELRTTFGENHIIVVPSEEHGLMDVYSDIPPVQRDQHEN
jgi:hypothetical protein